MTGLYVHIPFCRSKCPYCDFYSLTEQSLAEEYLNALKRSFVLPGKLNGYTDKNSNELKADTLYIGGGTPTVLSKNQLCSIISEARNSFNLSENSEITVEANPSSKDLFDKLQAMSAVGANRVSLGMQSACDAERRALGRLSSAEGVADAVKAAKAAGINNISLDVMLGVPGQTLNSLKETLSFALSLGVTHLSCYMLQLEPGTRFYKNQSKLNLPDEDSVCDMYLFMCSFLKNAGMRHYEISNFCFDNYYSRHNSKYWALEPYIGFGAAAHSYFNGKRFYYKSDINCFIAGEPPVFDCEGGTSDEKIMLSLRTDSGVDTNLINNKPGYGDIIKNGLAFQKNGRTVLTEKGMLVSNSVIASLI